MVRKLLSIYCLCFTIVVAAPAVERRSQLRLVWATMYSAATGRLPPDTLQYTNEITTRP